MKFRTYFDPVTGETKQLPIADQLRESYNQDATKGDVSNLNKVTSREPKIPLLNPDNINSSYVNIPEGDDLYKSPVPAALEPKKEEAAKTQTTTETPAKSVAEKEKQKETTEKKPSLNLKANYVTPEIEKSYYPGESSLSDIFSYGGEPLQMYYDGGGNDMYGLLGRMNAKSLTDPMYAQQFIGEDELTNPLGLNKDGRGKQTPKNYEDWETDTKYGRGYQNEDLANWMISGVDTVSALLRQKEMRDLEQGFRRNTLADNVFMSASPANRIGSRGRYVQTGMGSGMMDPQNMTPIYEPGANYDFSNPYVAYGGSYAYGGAYQEGGEYELSQDEINYIMANGGSITYID
jgi:hypothetical protein